MSSARRARRLEQARGGAPDDPPLLHHAFAAAAACAPDDVALVCGDAVLTRRELDARAARLAHRLRRCGVVRGDRVGVLAERTPAAIVGLLGALRAGAAYVPLDPHAPPRRLVDQVHEAGVAVVVTHDAARAAAPPGVELLSLDDPSLDDEPANDPAVAVDPDDLASIVFTSGSTGTPKGAAITHRGVAAYTASVCAALGIGPGLHLATVSTLTADLGNTSIFAALATGGVLHVVDHDTATDAGRLSAYLRRWPVDVLKIVPSHLAALLDAAGADVLPRRLLVLGGEALPLALVDRVAALAPGCAIANHYGPTETTVGALVLPLADFDDRRGCRTVPIGRPLPHAEAYVLDARLEPVAIGEIGELYLGGAGIARGYLGRPELTAARFVPHPFAVGARLYRTGDRVRHRPDGAVEFVGRVDHQVKIRGFRVELGEIEARLGEHPSIAQAAVVAQDGRLVAYVQPREGFDEPALRAFLAARVPDYMIPARIVTLRALPLTANGKLDRAALPRSDRAARAHVAPRTPVEQTIAAIWAEVLGVPRIGVADDFFELGGHSLLAIPLVHRIQQALGRSLSLATIFQAPTVEGLARALEAAAPPALVELGAGDGGPPLYCLDPTGAHVAAYRELAAALTERRVLGVELGPPLASEGPSIARIAARVARDLRGHSPGPYHVLGWSLGGVLALATARALEEAGEEVAFVGILDNDPRAELYAAGSPDPIAELARYLDPARQRVLHDRPAAELASLRAQLLAAPDDARVEVAVAWAQARGLVDAGAPPSAFRDRHALLADAAQYVLALPRPCVRAPLHVHWTDETLARRAPFDWAASTTGQVRVHGVGGDHAAAVQSDDAIDHLRAAITPAGPKRAPGES